MRSTDVSKKPALEHIDCYVAYSLCRLKGASRTFFSVMSAA